MIFISIFISFLVPLCIPDSSNGTFRISGDSLLAAPLYIGSAKQEIYGLYDFATIPIVVSSRECGIRRSGCSRYCNDDQFSHLYCDADCFPTRSHSFDLFCTNRFDSTNSTTYTKLDESWSAQLQCCTNRFYGNYARDVVVFKSRDHEPDFTPDYVFEFAEGISMQGTAFRNVAVSDKILGALIGLGFSHSAEHRNFVEQLYQFGHISQSLISISWYAVWVGELNTQVCFNWTFLPVEFGAGGGWTIQLDELKVLGVTFQKPKITLSSRVSDFMIPRFAYDYLVKQEIVHPDVTLCKMHEWDNRICVLQDHQLDFSFSVDQKTYKSEVGFSKTPETCGTISNRTYCLTVLESPQFEGGDRDEPWVLGTWALLDLCFALDYEKRTVGLARSCGANPC